MTRDEFIKATLLGGAGLVLMPSILTSCKKESSLNVAFKGKVLIIGAGAAGMMAGYSLFQNGVDFEILEAGTTFGGRVKQDVNLADFPLDIGAEWIHEKPSLFKRLINDQNTVGSLDLAPYNLKSISIYKNGNLQDINFVSPFYGEYKFTSSTWYQFFEKYIVSNFPDKITYNSPVTDIDYSGDQVAVTTLSGDAYYADRMIVTASLNVLKDGLIKFNPTLPQAKLDALNRTEMPDGLKVSIRFTEKFYPDLMAIGGLEAFFNDERLYFDGAFKKQTDHFVLTLFNVAGQAHELTDLGSDDAILSAVMAQLDEIFDGKASLYYADHVVQNWSAEEYVRGSYSFYGNDAEEIIDIISEPVNNKVYFAGEALNKEEWSTVHGAGFNGREVAEKIMEG